MIWHILRDHQVHNGAIGATITLMAKWIFENISPILGIVAAFGGVIMVVLSIIQKLKQNRLLDIELKQKEDQLNRNQ